MLRETTNPRPPHYESDVQPTAPRRRYIHYIYKVVQVNIVYRQNQICMCVRSSETILKYKVNVKKNIRLFCSCLHMYWYNDNHPWTFIEADIPWKISLKVPTFHNDSLKSRLSYTSILVFWEGYLLWKLVSGMIKQHLCDPCVYVYMYSCTTTNIQESHGKSTNPVLSIKHQLSINVVEQNTTIK